MLRRIFRTVMSTIMNKPHVPIPLNGVDYRGKIVLAPMVRSGELPSRLLSLKYGADLVWGPETVDKALIGCHRQINSRTNIVEFARMSSRSGMKKPPEESVLYKIDPVREKGKLIFQIGTSTPDLAVQAAKVVAGDVAGIDVNAGCPKQFSTSGGMGAALLQIPDRLCSILEALVKEVGNPFQIGISVKIRILAKPEETRSLVSRLCKTGIIGLTVHCRTTPMRPRERAIRDQIPMICDVCHEAGVALLINGDVDNRDHGLSLMQEYGVDGAMIATNAEANFSCFRSASNGGLLPWRELAHDYLEMALKTENKWGNTKFLLNQLLPGRDSTCKVAKTAKTHEQLCEMLGYTDLILLAKEVDSLMGKTLESDKRNKTNPTVERVMATNESALAAGDSGSSTPSKMKLKIPNGPGPVRSGASISSSMENSSGAPGATNQVEALSTFSTDGGEDITPIPNRLPA